MRAIDTEDEKSNFIKANFATKTHAQMANELGLSRQQVLRRCVALGLSKETMGVSLAPKFTEEEKQFIIRHAAKGSTWIHENIPWLPRSKESIKMQVKRLKKSGLFTTPLGISDTYTKTELDYIATFKETHSCEFLANGIGRGIDSVRKHLPIDNNRKKEPRSVLRVPWTPEEDEKIILMNQDGKTYAEVSKILETRTEGAVSTRTKQLLRAFELIEKSLTETANIFRDLSSEEQRVFLGNIPPIVVSVRCGRLNATLPMRFVSNRFYSTYSFKTISVEVQLLPKI